MGGDIPLSEMEAAAWLLAGLVTIFDKEAAFLAAAAGFEEVGTDTVRDV